MMLFPTPSLSCLALHSEITAPTTRSMTRRPHTGKLEACFVTRASILIMIVSSSCRSVEFVLNLSYKLLVVQLLGIVTKVTHLQRALCGMLIATIEQTDKDGNVKFQHCFTCEHLARLAVCNDFYQKCGCDIFSGSAECQFSIMSQSCPCH